MFSSLFFCTTASFVFSSMQSKRRITVRGNITSPYSWGLYEPFNLSAIAQMRLAFSFMLIAVDGNMLASPWLVSFYYSYYYSWVQKSERAFSISSHSGLILSNKHPLLAPYTPLSYRTLPLDKILLCKCSLTSSRSTISTSSSTSIDTFP